MQRILIIGSGGAGKSTLARELGARLGIDVAHLDAHYWKSNWVPTPATAWQERIHSLIAEERWILDGNYNATMPMRLAAADTVIFLDLPRHLCLWRVVKRRILFHGRGRPDIAEGCRVRLTRSFLFWIWTYPYAQRPRVLRMLAAQAGHKRVVHLRTTDEVGQFLHNLGATRGLNLKAEAAREVTAAAPLASNAAN